MTYRDEVGSLGIDCLSRKRGTEDRIAHRPIAMAPPVDVLGSNIVWIWGNRIAGLEDMSRIPTKGM
jgi:hypothetical protein